MEKAQEQVAWVSNARGIACIMVILLHVAAIYVIEAPVPTAGFAAGNLLDSFCRACVPIFLMISGFLYMNVTTLRMKHIIRVLCALVFYSLPAFFYKRFVSGEPYGLFDILHEPAFFHLWYFYALLPILIFLYVLRPSLNTGVTEGPVRLYAAMFLVLAIFIYLSPFARTLLPQYVPSGPIRHNNFLLVFYFVLGALAGRIETDKYGARFFWLGLFLFLSLAIFHLTTWEATEMGDAVGNYYNYQNPLVIAASLALFIFIRSLDFRSSFLDVIARNSLAIYGVQAYIMALLVREFERSPFHPLPQMALYTLATLTLSLAFAVVLKRFDRQGYVT